MLLLPIGGVIAAHALPLAGLAAVSLIGVLLNLTGLEVVVDDDIRLDSELRVVGFANVGVAAVAGMVGYHMMSFTVLADRLRARGRVVRAKESSPIAVSIVEANDWCADVLTGEFDTDSHAFADWGVPRLVFERSRVSPNTTVKWDLPRN